MKYWVVIILLFGLTAPARADWYEASSDHFVIYADDSEKDIRRFAENLERYHSAIEYVTQRKIETPSPSNRVTIFVVGDQNDIRKLAGTKSRSLAGFYVPRAGASRAFVQDIRLKSGYPSFSTIVLLHEYAHHFLISSSRHAMPRWVSEGAAEFFAAATFRSDGGVQIGRPALHRAGDFAYADEVPIEELFDHELYERNRGKRYDAFYGQSWALFHFLTFSEERRGQLRDYLVRITKGESSPDAAQAAFGDIGQLGTEVRNYLRQRRMMNFVLKPEHLSIGQIAIRKLPRGEADMIDVRIRSQRGVTREEAAELLPDARRIAAKHPDDPAVLAALAEAEFDAGNNTEAIAAADRALAIDPENKDAYVQKGFALFRMAEDAAPEDVDAAYRAAMQPFAKLNALENDHPLPLIYYYRSFAERGEVPSPNARNALRRASELAPFDHSLALNTAFMLANAGEIDDATMWLEPVAANPHGGNLAAAARKFIEALGEAEEGVPLRIAAAFDHADDPDADADEGDEGDVEDTGAEDPDGPDE